MFISSKSRSHIKLGHIGSKARMSEGQILDNHVYTLEDTVLIKSSGIFVTMKKRTDLKVGHIGSETRSLGQILENHMYSLAGTVLSQSA